MKKKLFMALGIALALLACIGVFDFISGVSGVSAAIQEANAQGESTTSIYIGAITDVLTIVVMIVAAVVCFTLAFEDGGVGYEITEDEEEETEVEEDDEEYEEEPEEQIERINEEKRLAEEQRKAPKGLSDKFLKNKKGKKKAEQTEDVAAEPEILQEPCLQCKTCAHRLADDDHCRVYARKPSYIKNNRFECNEYKQK